VSNQKSENWSNRRKGRTEKNILFFPSILCETNENGVKKN
jgi:hypothetical protein